MAKASTMASTSEAANAKSDNSECKTFRREISHSFPEFPLAFIKVNGRLAVPSEES